MVHQHFKLVHNFTVLENVILGVETTQKGLLKMDEARKKVVSLSEKYGLKIDPDALISDITVGMQQLKMLMNHTNSQLICVVGILYMYNLSILAYLTGFWLIHTKQYAHQCLFSCTVLSQ